MKNNFDEGFSEEVRKQIEIRKKSKLIITHYTPQPPELDAYVSVCFFTRNDNGTYHVGTDLSGEMTQEEMNDRVKAGAACLVDNPHEISYEGDEDVWISPERDIWLASEKDLLEAGGAERCKRKTLLYKFRK